MKSIRPPLAAAVLGAGLPMHDAGAVNLAADGIGEVAIAPYYTVRDGWQTLVNLTNTTQHPVAVKLRVHEAWNSRDVFDITILMSSFDNFTAMLTDDGAGTPVFRVIDTDTCTTPLGATQANVGDALPQREWPLSAFAYGGTTNPAAPREWDGGPTSDDRLREGYVEFLVMGHYTNDGGLNDVVDMTLENPATGSDLDGGANTTGDDSPGELIEAHSCVALDTMFASRANVLTAARFAGEPINALKFNYRLINVGRGVEAGGSATTWANFFNPGPDWIDGEVLSGDGPAVPGPYNIDGLAAWGWPLTAGAENNSAGEELAADTACDITRGQERSTATASPAAGDEWNPDWESASFVVLSAGLGSCLNLITAQTTFDFLEPTLNDAYPVIANGWVDRYNLELDANIWLEVALLLEGRIGPDTAWPQPIWGIGSMRGIDAVSLTIQRSAVINEWADNPDPSGVGTGVATDWIVNFPTKSFYVDQDPGLYRDTALSEVAGNGLQAALVPLDRDEAYYVNPPPNPLGDATVVDVPYPPFRTGFITTTGTDGSATIVENPVGACVGVQYNVYDRAENTLGAGGGSIPSPASPVLGEDLCYETNVLGFNGSNVLGSQVMTDVDTGALHDYGSLHLTFSDPEANAAGSGAIWTGDASGLVGWSGLPTTGFVIKQRNVGTVSGNYASSMDHGYRRTCDETAQAWLFASFQDCTGVRSVDPN